LLQHPSTKDNEINICQDLLAIENTDSDLKVLALHYGNELLVSDFPFKHFCKIAKQAKTIRNYHNRFCLWLSIVWATHKLIRFQSEEFSCVTFLYRTWKQKLMLTTTRCDSFILVRLKFLLTMSRRKVLITDTDDSQLCNISLYPTLYLITKQLNSNQPVWKWN